MNGKDLRQLIRAQLDGVDESDLWDVTRKVVAQIDPGDYVDALEITMRNYVTVLVKDDRNRAIRSPMETDDSPEPAPVTLAPRPKPGPSRRSMQVAAWRRRLDVLVTPVMGDGRPKRLGACSLAEVKMIAGHYARAAKDNRVQAEWYGRIAEAMLAVKAKTVADLPDGTLRPLLEKVAAA